MSLTLTAEFLDSCANDPKGPVALHFLQHLVPVEGKGAPFFPPTFAMDEKYNIDTLADGTKVALVDSVGSQANRMEPLFLQQDYADLVPQVAIRYGDEPHQVVSLLEAGHRLGDAIVRSTELADQARQAFLSASRGDSGPLAKLAPTSILFGAWDSRDTGTKLPRIVQSVIRAWGVSKLRRSAQFNPAIDYSQLGLVGTEESMKKAEKDELAQRGYLHVPSTGDHGGIVAAGPIRRDVTVNLVALRRVNGERGNDLRRYLLGLALIAAGEPQDPFLRQGCILVPDCDEPGGWTAVGRSGARMMLSWDQGAAAAFARQAASAYGVGQSHAVAFEVKRAKDDMKAKDKKK